MKTSTFTLRKIKTDAKMKFYIGINTLILFNKIFRLSKAYGLRRKYVPEIFLKPGYGKCRVIIDCVY